MFSEEFPQMYHKRSIGCAHENSDCTLAHAPIMLKIFVQTPLMVFDNFMTKNQFQPPLMGFGHLSSEARVTSLLSSIIVSQ